MEEEKKQEWENSQPNETTKPKKTINKFVIKFIIFVIILIALTATGIYFTIKHIDKSSENQISEETNNQDDDEAVEEKILQKIVNME